MGRNSGLVLYTHINRYGYCCTMYWYPVLYWLGTEQTSRLIALAVHAAPAERRVHRPCRLVSRRRYRVMYGQTTLSGHVYHTAWPMSPTLDGCPAHCKHYLYVVHDVCSFSHQYDTVCQNVVQHCQYRLTGTRCTTWYTPTNRKVSSCRQTFRASRSSHTVTDLFIVR